MKRLFWLGLGIAVGVLVVRKLTASAQSYTPRGLAKSAQESARNLQASARGFVDDVRAGAAEHEEQLIEAIAEQERVDARR